jgi:hypothetical protein
MPQIQLDAGRSPWLNVCVTPATTRRYEMAATQNHHDARDAYQAHANDIARLLEALQDALASHAAKATTNPRDWGRVGDLQRTRVDLIDTVAGLTGRDREAMELFLAE